MSDAKSQAEPSMEEILASIRRIISEDADVGQRPTPAAPAAAPAMRPVVAAPAMEREDVLNLTQRLDEDVMDLGEPIRPVASMAPRMAEPAPVRTMERPAKADLDLDFGLDDPLDSTSEPAFDDGDFERGLLSRAAAGAATDALSRLDQAVAAPVAPERPKRPVPSAAPSFAAGMTVEQLVAETLKPILRDWLDENLPAMVEDMVQAEIQRLTASRRR